MGQPDVSERHTAGPMPFPKRYACFYMKFYRSPRLSITAFITNGGGGDVALRLLFPISTGVLMYSYAIFSVCFVSVFAALLKVVFLMGFAFFQYKITI